MRKLFLSIVAAAALLTSCSKDDTTSAPVNQRSKVTFAVNAPELATRAGEGNGLTAKNLEYVIYDLAEDTSVEANLITGKTTFPEGSLTTSVTVDLVEGRTYEAIFFATADDAPYNFNKTEQTMTINTEKLMANQEGYDAFYKYVEPFTIGTTAMEMDVKMKRPFAQLNVATDDLDKDGGKLIDAKTTGVEVKAYTTLDFKSGDVDGQKTIVYGLSKKMDGTIKANSKDYKWLTMNYLLVNSRELVDVKFVFTDEPNNGSDNPLTRNYTSVPVERNYRTNIVGSILTNKTEFKVEILPGFETPDEIYDVDKTKEVVVNSGAELQAAIDAASADNDVNIIKFGKDITTATTRATDPAILIVQKEGVNLVIDGDGYKFNGKILVDGEARQAGTESLTFSNIKFTTSVASLDIIDANNSYTTPKNSNNYNYSHNITVENCTFTATGSAAQTAVAMKLRAAKNISVINSTATSLHSMMQLYGTSGVVNIDGVTISGGKNGISLGTSTNVVIKNSNIAATGYGVRADGNNGSELTVSNTTIEAKQPIIARKVNITTNNGVQTTHNYSIVLEGQNVLTTDENYQIVFTNGDDEAAYVAPEADWSITGADNFNVFPRETIIATADELKAFRDAVNAGTSYEGKVVKLAADIDLNNEAWTPIGGTDGYANNFDGTFDGNGHTISTLTVNSNNAGLFGTLGGAIIKNLTIDGATLTSNHYAGGVAAWVESGATNSDVKPTIENCHVKNATITVTPEEINGQWDNGDKAGGIVGYYVNATIIGCSVENTTIKAYRDCGGIVGSVNGGTVKNNSIENVTLVHNNEYNYKNIDSETHKDLNFGDIIGRRVGEVNTEGGNSGVATKQGGIFNGYYIDADGVGYVWKATGLNLCLVDTDLADNAPTIKLAAEVNGNEYDINNGAKKTLTFIGTEVSPADVVIKIVGGTQSEAGGQLDYGLDGSTVTFNNLTIKTNNQTYAGYARLTATFNNCIMDQCFCLNGDSTFNDCTLNVSGDQYNIWTWGAPTATFTNCTFNSDGKAMLLYGTANTKLTINSCVFNDSGVLPDLKAAIEIGNDYGKSYELIVNDTVVNGYEINDKGINTGTTLWANKNSMGKDKLNVVVDGVDVY